MKNKEIKKYKAVLAMPETDNDTAVNLVNIKDKKDVIWAADDEFTIGEIIREDELMFEMNPCVWDEGYGEVEFAYKKK